MASIGSDRVPRPHIVGSAARVASARWPSPNGFRTRVGRCMSESRGGDNLGSGQSARFWAGFDGPPPWYLDLVGVGWVVAAAVAVMLPALTRGASLGPYGLLARDGLLIQHGGGARNPFAADQITQMIPWTSLAWEQVHHGHLPLWNPYNALGTPLAFNWQSATFSLPALLGYLVPLRLAYTTQVLATLAIGGTGCYFLGRVLHLNLLACAFAGTVFELCGTFMGWLGWPVASVMSWAGWLFAAAILVLRGGRRVVRSPSSAWCWPLPSTPVNPMRWSSWVAFLPCSSPSCSFLGPGRVKTGRGASAPSGICCRHHGRTGPQRPASPPWHPTPVAVESRYRGWSVRDSAGSPVATTPHRSGPGPGRGPDRVARGYIGVVAVALALIRMIICRRRPEVSAIGVVAVIAGIFSFTPLANSLLDNLPVVGAVRWARSITFLEFAVAVLAGVGMDVVIRRSTKRAVLRLAAVLFSLAALTVATIWVTHPRGDRIRHENLAWAAAGAGLGLIVVGCLEFVRWRRLRSGSSGAEPGDDGRLPRTVRRWGLGAAVVLFAFQTSFLMTMGGSLWGSTSRPFHSTTVERQLKRAVGSSLVGFGASACQKLPTLGIPADANIVYGVRELAVYDPMLPRRYYQAWVAVTGQKAGYPRTSRYCPAVTSVTMARTYGVSYILEFHGAPGPKGTVDVGRIGGEDLYRVPATTADAILVPAPKSRALPPDDARGTPVAPASSNPARWTLVVAPPRPAVLRLHLTDVPGWHASIDGKPLVLESFSSVMLQARIPAGRHVIVLSYWPDTFTAGIVLAALSAVGLATALVIGGVRRRRALRDL